MLFIGRLQLVLKHLVFFYNNITYKCLHGLVPPYLAGDCRLMSVSPRLRSFHSSDSSLLFVPRKWRIIVSRSFSIARPTVVNSLTTALRDLSLSLNSFTGLLKNFFWLCSRGAFVTVKCTIETYLLTHDSVLVRFVADSAINAACYSSFLGCNALLRANGCNCSVGDVLSKQIDNNSENLVSDSQAQVATFLS